MAISPPRLTIYLYSAHRAVIFAIAQLSCDVQTFGFGRHPSEEIVYVTLKQYRENSAALQQHNTVVTMTSKVNGKTEILTPCRSETPENFITKTRHIDYVAWGNMHAKFYGSQTTTNES